MRARYRFVAAVVAALIVYAAVAASLAPRPQAPVVVVDLPIKACVRAGCLYPQVYAVIVYASSPPGTPPYVSIRYLPPGSKAMFTIPPALYDAWARYLVTEGGSSVPSVGVVVLGYTSNIITYAIRVLANAASPLSPIHSGTKEVVIEDSDFDTSPIEPPPIPGYGDPASAPAGLTWGSILSTGVPEIDKSPTVIAAGVGQAAGSQYVKKVVRLSNETGNVALSATPVTAESSGGASSVSAYLGSGLYAIIFTYEGLPLFVVGVVRAGYAGTIAAVNETVSLNITVLARINGTEAVPLLYPINLSATALYWVPAPLISIRAINFSFITGGECIEAPMKVSSGGVVVHVREDVKGLYAGDMNGESPATWLPLQASLYPLTADAAVMAYSGSPVVEVGVRKGLLGGVCVVGHEKSGWGGGCVGGFCPG